MSKAITDTKIAKFYGTTTRSLRNWKKDEILKRRYLAFVDYYKKEVGGNKPPKV